MGGEACAGQSDWMAGRSLPAHFCRRVETRVGQNHINMVCVPYFLQENHQIYGNVRCVCTVFSAGESPNIR